MWPNETMEWTYDGLRYRVADSTLIAHNWDSETAGSVKTTTFLYLTPEGRYFAVHISRLQDKPDQFESLTVPEAQYYYDILRKKVIPKTKAF